MAYNSCILGRFILWKKDDERIFSFKRSSCGREPNWKVIETVRIIFPEQHTLTYFQTNPIQYTVAYFGHKDHIGQNEKMIMFGLTHVVAIDGFSGKIVAAVSMPIKNCISIYEHMYM